MNLNSASALICNILSVRSLAFPLCFGKPVAPMHDIGGGEGIKQASVDRVDGVRGGGNM